MEDDDNDDDEGPHSFFNCSVTSVQPDIALFVVLLEHCESKIIKVR